MEADENNLRRHIAHGALSKGRELEIYFRELLSEIIFSLADCDTINQFYNVRFRLSRRAKT